MQKQYRLAKRKDFNKVYRLGKSAANRQFVVYFMANPKTEKMRVGISTSKKLGGAVLRNRVRRRVKEIVRLNSDRILPGHDLIIIVRKAAMDMTYAELENSLMHALKRASVYRKKNR